MPATVGASLEAGVAHIARVIEHTQLKPQATPQDLERLCAEARTWGLLAVCVHPSWVAACRDWLAGSPVMVVSVVGFPLGQSLSASKADEARRVFALGAHEVDTVLHIGRLRAGDGAYVRRDIAAVVAVRPPGARVKVILETALLSEEEVVSACRAAGEAGADFVKTSTGFGPGGASVSNVALLRRLVGPEMGVKAAGGIRDLAGAACLLAAGASRIGSSAGAAIVAAARAGVDGLGPVAS